MGLEGALACLVFSSWVDHSNWRDLLSKEDKGGLYLFARFKEAVPSGPANPLEENVVYIGQSSRSFRSRWYLFYSGLEDPEEARNNPAKYPRALRYLETFREGGILPHVACLPIGELGLEQPREARSVRLALVVLENKLLDYYYEANRKLPAIQSKRVRK